MRQRRMRRLATPPPHGGTRDGRRLTMSRPTHAGCDGTRLRRRQLSCGRHPLTTTTDRLGRRTRCGRFYGPPPPTSPRRSCASSRGRSCGSSSASTTRARPSVQKRNFRYRAAMAATRAADDDGAPPDPTLAKETARSAEDDAAAAATKRDACEGIEATKANVSSF